MKRSLQRRLFAAAAAVAVVMAYVQVASLPPTSTEQQQDYTWDSFVSEVRGDIAATVTGIRRERDERKAVLTRMRDDLRVLDQQLSVENPNRSG